MIKTILYTYLSKAFKIGMWFSILWLIVNFILLVSDLQDFKPVIIGLISVLYVMSKILKQIGLNHLFKTEKERKDNILNEKIKTGCKLSISEQFEIATRKNLKK
mgnify:CR=1 FL=1